MRYYFQSGSFSFVFSLFVNLLTQFQPEAPDLAFELRHLRIPVCDLGRLILLGFTVKQTASITAKVAVDVLHGVLHAINDGSAARDDLPGSLMHDYATTTSADTFDTR